VTYLAKHPASPRPPARLERSVFCNKAPVKSEVSYRRFEQSNLMRRWGDPSKPLSTDAQGIRLGALDVESDYQVAAGRPHQRSDDYFEALRSPAA